eukprot:gene31518-39655_t
MVNQFVGESIKWRGSPDDDKKETTPFLNISATALELPFVDSARWGRPDTAHTGAAIPPPAESATFQQGPTDVPAVQEIQEAAERQVKLLKKQISFLLSETQMRASNERRLEAEIAALRR